MTAALRGAEIVARTPERAGLTDIFTLSGNHIMSLLDAALDTTLRLMHVRHEAAAVPMADACGRLTGRPGIARVIGGPGHANAVGALFTALGQETPVLLISGHAETGQIGRGGFQEPRQVDMAAPVTHAAGMATDTARLGMDVAKAIRLAGSGRPGPLHGGGASVSDRDARCGAPGDQNDRWRLDFETREPYDLTGSGANMDETAVPGLLGIRHCGRECEQQIDDRCRDHGDPAR